MRFEPKEEYIEHEILCHFMEKWCKVNYKNDIKWFYNEKKWYYQKNKSNFIRNWISDITIFRNWTYIAIEVKKPSEMKYFDVSLSEAKERYIQAQLSWKNVKKARHAFEQREFIEDIKAEWWVWFFACSLDQVLERLEDNCVVL